MSSSPSVNPPHYRWNYAAHVLDGGFYMGSQALLSANTVLTTAIMSFGGPAWLISLMPIMMMLGVAAVPVFTAHRLDRLTRSMPLLLTTGFVQRLPILAIGLVLLGYPDRPLLLCFAVAAGHLLSGIACGVGLPAWQELLAHTVPSRRRSSVFANRYLIGSAMGLAGGWVVKRTLAAHPGAAGFGMLHLYAFGILVVSYVVFASLRETPRQALPEHTHLSLLANLRAVPGMVARNRQYGLYLGISVLPNGVYFLAPFLALHCLHILGKPKSYVGVFVVAQMAGGVVGNVVSGWLGDRRGGRLVLVVSQAALLAAAALALAAQTPAGCWAAFFGLGLAETARNVGGGTLLLEIVPNERRATALAVSSLVQVASLLICSGLSAWFWQLGGLMPIGIAALAMAGLTLAGLTRIQEPRRLPAPVPA
ncbi:MAG: MFS transporter [Lentisphaeria bacterium]|jgi:MFS family permease|nr:MFS transporter [Lentisphaeria bacterium]